MAIDEIEGETSDTTYTARCLGRTIAPNINQLNKPEKLITSYIANGTVNNLNYTDEGDDVILLDTNDPKSRNNSFVNDRISISSSYVGDCGLQQPLGLVEEEESSRDGLKPLSELSDLFFSCASLQSEGISAKSATIPIGRESCETNISLLSEKNAMENINLIVPNRQVNVVQEIQPARKRPFVEKDRQAESQTNKYGDIQFYLNKIFEIKEDMQPSPVVIKMNDTPIISSENGVVTVIYKPEKIKFRRTIENYAPVSTKLISLVEEQRKGSRSSKKKICPNKSQEKQNGPNCRRFHPNSKIKSFADDLTGNERTGNRFTGAKKKYISGIKWMKKKYPPICKVKFKGKMVYKCKDCDFIHASKVAALRRHMIIHQTGDSVDWFYCDLCNYRAKRKGNLKVHMILHRNPDDLVWFKCEMCDKKFKHKNGLYAHEKRHIKRDELELYLCDQCSYKTPFKHTLLRHKIIHEPTEKKKLLLCSMCSYSTYNKYYLSRHRQTHSEPIYKCLLCTYEAKYKVNLEIHMKRHYPQEEIFYCDSCDYSTNRRYTLTLHNRNIHNFYSSQEDQTFFCYNCPFQTRFKRCLVKHMSMHCGVSGRKDNNMLPRIKTEVISD